MTRQAFCRNVLLGCVFAGFVAASLLAQAPAAKPAAKVVELDTHGGDYLSVLSGPPETVSMRSGLVVLKPGHSVGRHSTGQNEEILVVLEGEGEMLFAGGRTMPVKANHALYCPPNTEHDVKNTGKGALRYVYVVAAARR